ncbi:MAG: DUF2911 domain-containing protein [Saprospiraceae bacterium]|nr:DUF2911 domain-containing protein [Saprospiraceae bacterium]
MKNLFAVLLLVAFTAFSVEAQIKTPAASPSATVMQTVGLTDVTIEYSRPSAKGRTIFGADALVPNGKMWRTGANSVTKITFSNDVMIEGQELKAGKYGVLTMPNSSSWAVHFYNFEGNGWGSYVEKTPAVAVNVTPKGVKHYVESFTISVDDLKADGATINFSWANTMVPVSVSTHADKTVMANIDKVMAGPSKADYYNAASYYFTAGKDLDKALEWVTIATDGPDKKFWQIKRKSEILGALGKKAEAIEAAKMSLELATKAGNADYIKMNNDNIKKWSM